MQEVQIRNCCLIVNPTLLHIVSQHFKIVVYINVQHLQLFLDSVGMQIVDGTEPDVFLFRLRQLGRLEDVELYYRVRKLEKIKTNSKYLTEEY
jgi:hypothetical protein